MEILGLFWRRVFKALRNIRISPALSLHFCGIFKGTSSLSFLISLGTETLSSRKNQVAELCTKLLITSQANGIFFSSPSCCFKHFRCFGWNRKFRIYSVSFSSYRGEYTSLLIAFVNLSCLIYNAFQPHWAQGSNKSLINTTFLLRLSYKPSWFGSPTGGKSSHAWRDAIVEPFQRRCLAFSSTSKAQVKYLWC